MPERLFVLYMALVGAVLTLVFLAAWYVLIGAGIFRSVRHFLDLLPNAGFGK